MTAGDAERRRLERDLHDGAQQRLVGIALQLSLLKGRIKSDPATAEQLVNAAGDELALSLAELRELARGIHPAVLEHGLAAALESLAARATVADEGLLRAVRAPARAGRARRLLRRLRGAGQRRQVRARDRRLDARPAPGQMASIEIADDGVGGADDTAGSGLRGLADRVEALEGHLRVTSPVGAGTVITAELPCAWRPPAVGPAPAA